MALGGNRYDPYLVLDTGTDTDGDGDIELDDEILIADGIENLQVAYLFAAPSLAPVGAVSDTPIALSTAAPAAAAETIALTDFPGTGASTTEPYELSSFYKYSVTTLPVPAIRGTNAQANIRRVLLSVVARSPTPEPGGRSNHSWTAGSSLFRLNQSGAPAWITDVMVDGNDGYQRTVAETSVNLPNMTVRTMTYF